MQPGGRLYGFEWDINRLIDAFALQADQDGCASLQTFKRLFQLAGYAYLHQAYPGCEHNPEYIQLLYATALDRLDVPSPTAPASSPLWRLHALATSTSEPTAAAAAGGMWSLTTAHAQGHTAPAGVMAAQQAATLTGSSAQAQGLNVAQLLSAHTGAALQQAQGMFPGQQRWQPLPAQPVGRCCLGQEQQQPIAGPGIHSTNGAATRLRQKLQPVPQLAQVLQQQAPSSGQPPQVLQPQQYHQDGAAAASLDMPLFLHDDEMGDDFLDDLLAIFDEAEADEAPPGTAAPAVPEDGTTSSTSQQLHRPRQPAPASPSILIPVVVKAAVVFMLHCLYESQLNRPHVCIYVPLSSLRALGAAAADFRAAGSAAADGLLVLQVLLAHQRLLIGRFKRPGQWQAQLPEHLQPWPGILDLGLGSTAANKAAARVGTDQWRVAAVKAAARAARSLVRQVNPHYRQDTPEHREAMFHIRSTLNSLSNFKALQSLSCEYADARRAIFEPLLALKERVRTAQAAAAPAAASAAAEQPEEQADQQEEWWQKPRKSSKPKQKATAKQRKSDTPPPPLAAPPAPQPAWERAAQTWTASGAPICGHRTDVPELFDRSFGADLQELANEEAARMLVLLDPAYDASKIKKRQRQQQEAAEPAAPAAGHSRQSKAQTSRAPVSTAGRWSGRYLDDMAAAGLLQTREVQEMQQGVRETAEVVKGLGVPQQVLQLQAERRQRAMHVAEEWFAAHDAMLAHEGGDDVEDMP